MIKNIFLHIGVHKTASTTIQNTFYNEREKLAEAGILYPVFKIGETNISNHSIPFYSLFMTQPERFHINVSFGFTTQEAISQIHQEYRRQIQEQIVGFAGDTLVISGEDISLLTTDELEKLKAYLLEITQPEVNFRVIMMCRHPVSRFRSALQASVCAFGLPVQKAIERNLRRTNLYQNLITAFSEVFEREHITVLKYEDSISHSYGPAGAFLAIVDKNMPDKIKPALLHDNPSHKYEAFVLLNAINQTCYPTSGNELQPGRMVELNQLFREMPGQKFMLLRGFSKKVWETLAEDANWLCHEFSLPEYRFQDGDLKPDADMWSRQTIDYLRNVLPGLALEYRKIILRELLQHAMSQQSKIRFNKRINLLIFILTQLKTAL